MSKKYKLVIMGASGVGKTVFLGSYFYATIQRGMKKRYPDPISLHIDAVKPAQDLMGKLFKGTQGGTDKRVNMSFNVDNKMEVELSDLPGGYTTDVDQWLAQGIKEDLENANGVIFFISADDLLHNYLKCSNDVFPFATAISQYVRVQKAGSQEQRADVPIYFLFTKGDLIKNDVDKNGNPYTAQTLMDLIPGLNRACKVGAKSVLFRKGAYDRPYLTTALGDWFDANTPPLEKDYQPINVIEPMEDMFDAMRGSRRINTAVKGGIKTTLYTVCAVAAVVLAISTNWGWQKFKWNRAENAARLAVSQQDYAKAISSYEGFRSSGTLLGFSLPSFMSPGSDVNDRIDKLWNDYEAVAFAKLTNYLQIADINRLPDSSSTSFTQGADAIDAYLRNETFITISPEHFAEVKKVEPYYAMGRSMTETIETFDDIQKVLGRIDMMPENWRDPLMNRIQLGVHNWALAVDKNVSAQESEEPGSGIQTVSEAIAQARALLEHPWLADELKLSLSKQVDTWDESKTKLWNGVITARIAKANNADSPEESLKMLEALQSEAALPDDSLQIVLTSIEKQYNAIVAAKIADKVDSAEMRNLLNQYPSMTSDARNNAFAYIQRLDGIQLADQKRRIVSAASLEDLVETWNGVTAAYAGNDSALQELTDSLQNRFDVLVTDEQQAAERSVAAVLSNKDYESVKANVDEFCQRMNATLTTLSAYCSTSTAESSMINWQGDIFSRAAAEEYNDLRSRFRSITGASGVSSLASRIRQFCDRWPSSSHVSEAHRVREYLEEIQSGVNATLVIVSARVSTSYDTFGQNDLFIKVEGPASGETAVIEDNNNPQFNYPVRFKWTVDCSPFGFTIYDKDKMSDELITRIAVNCSGVSGWTNLNGSHSNGGATIDLRVENIPECPWSK